MHPPARARTGFTEGREKTGPIHRVAEDRLLPITAVERMVEGAGKFHTRFAGHAPLLPTSPAP